MVDTRIRHRHSRCRQQLSADAAERGAPYFRRPLTTGAIQMYYLAQGQKSQPVSHVVTTCLRPEPSLPSADSARRFFSLKHISIVVDNRPTDKIHFAAISSQLAVPYPMQDGRLGLRLRRNSLLITWRIIQDQSGVGNSMTTAMAAIPSLRPIEPR